MKKILISLSSTLLFFAIAFSADPNWEGNFSGNDYEYSATLANATITIDGADSSNGKVAAFVGDEVRGVDTNGATLFPPSGANVWEVSLYSNQLSGETITFKYYDDVNDIVMDLNESVVFESDAIFGASAFDPFLLTGTASCNGDYDECGVCNGNGIEDGACDCDGNVDLGCGCDETAPSGCDEACGSNLEFDECGVCGGSGLEENFDCDGNCTVDTDCAGICGGDAVVDCNGDCDGGASVDCHGICNGDNTLDECGVCDGDGIPEWACDCDLNLLDCNGICDGDANTDECGVCEGDNSTCLDECGVPNGDGPDCLGNCNGDAELDECGVCDGEGIADGVCDCEGNIEDCLGNCNGDAELDECGVCDGEGIADGACDCEGNGLYASCDTIGSPNESCIPGEDSIGQVCANDGFENEMYCYENANNDFICGTPESADLDNPINCTDDVCDCDGTPPEENFDCEGNCTVGTDCNGDCGGDAVEDCLGDCNGDAELDECGVCDGEGIADGACDCDGNVEDCLGDCNGDAELDECGVCDGDGPEENFDCDGNCTVDIDCNGDCDGDAEVDCAGNCGGYAELDEDGICIEEEQVDCIANGEDYCESGNFTDAESCNTDSICSWDEEDGVGSCFYDCDDSCDTCDDGDGCASGIYDCAGVCDGDAVDVGCGCDIDATWCLPLIISFGVVTSETLEVLYESPYHAISGFQFDVDGVSLNGGYGGDAAAAGFEVSTGANTALGFSIEGNIIPEGSGVLTILNISYTEEGDACLSDVIFADGNFSNINNIIIDDCVTLPCEADCAGVCDGDSSLDDCGVCEGDGESCAVYVEFEITTTLDEPIEDEEELADFEEDFEGYMETELGLPEDTVEVLNIEFTELRDVQVMIEFSITLTEEELADTDFDEETIEEDIEESVTDIEEEIDEGFPDFIYGCTDDFACNYDSDATNDDQSCEYAEENFDCEGNCTVDTDCNDICGGDAIVDECGDCDGDGPEENFDCDGNCTVDTDCNGDCGGDAEVDECGVCEGDDSTCTDECGVINGDGASYECIDGSFACDIAECPSNIEIGFGTVTDSSIEITYTSSADMGGFQFTMSGLYLLGASGGVAETAGFTTSVGAESGIVIGFSFTGSVIPAGSGVLTVINASNPMMSIETCLSDAVISDTNAEQFDDIIIGDCASLELLATEDIMPSEYNLSQNYPNPFNPVTNISFSVAEAGQISLKVFDLLGTQVSELANDFYMPGNYNVIWNAVDTYGNEVSSGVYIYQLSTKDGIFTNRMMLMR